MQSVWKMITITTINIFSFQILGLGLITPLLKEDQGDRLIKERGQCPRARQHRNEKTVQVLKQGISQGNFYFGKGINKDTKFLTNAHQMRRASLASDPLYSVRQELLFTFQN